MTGTPQTDAIKAVSCEINLGESVLDAYMLPSGEKRIGVENTGVALGYSERFFFQRTGAAIKNAEALAGYGIFRRTTLGENRSTGRR